MPALTPSPPLTVAELLGQSFAILLHRFVVYVLVAALPLAGLSVSVFLSLEPGGLLDFGLTGVILFVVATCLLAGLAQATICGMVVDRLRGGEGSLFAALRLAAKRSPSILALSTIPAILSVAMILHAWWVMPYGALTWGLSGLAMTIVGLVVTALFWTAVPAVIAEQRGPLSALARGLALSRGARWTSLLSLAIVSAVCAAWLYLAKVSVLSGTPTIGMLRLFVAECLVLTVLVQAHLSVAAAFAYARQTGISPDPRRRSE